MTDRIGNMTVEPLETYESGAKRSDRTGKGRYDLISSHGLRRLSFRYEDGAVHKGDRNWEKGFPVSRCADSTMRHLCQLLAGDRTEDHWAAIAWQAFAAMHFEEEVAAGRLPVKLLDIKVIECSTSAPTAENEAKTGSS